MSAGKRKMITGELQKPGTPATVKKEKAPRTKIRHYVYACKADGVKNGVYYWNVFCGGRLRSLVVAISDDGRAACRSREREAAAVQVAVVRRV